MAHEGFRTHTSYLNLHWNDKVIARWKAAHFAGKDYEYDGSKIDTLTGFKYIDDHLGYRFVLRESWLPDTVGTGKTLRAKLKIQNVGFGNLTKDAKVYLIVEESERDFGGLAVEPAIDTIRLTSLDFRNVHSRKIEVSNGDTTMTFDGINEIDLEETLPMVHGKNDLYLAVEGVTFANNGSKTPFGSYPNLAPLYLGSFVYDSRKTESIDVKFRTRGEAKLQTRVERADQKIQVRDGRSRSNALGKNRDGSGDKLFRANGKAVK